MSVQPEAAEPAVAQPPSALLRESLAEVFTHLDGVIDHATKAQRHSRHEGDDKAFEALDDALSLLQHVRSRLRYDLMSGSDGDVDPAR